ncbi:MAG TPA: N-acyl homoserine lactonase family protein [Candidatus Limnocylindria bacterium]|nr:N-acyl homoserine lactonase family protein [Candidatus Limnocylindria bacterium]
MRADDIVPLHVADVTYPASHPLAGQTGPVMAFLIRHSQGLVLVDTGLGEGDTEIEELYKPHIRNIKVAIYGAKIEAEDVSLVINTHMHFDHAGANSEFPDVAILVQEAEWQVAWDEGYTVRSWIDFPDASYLRLHGDTDVADGLRVLSTPGHSPGHQSVAVETEDGLVLIAGQAAQDARDFATRRGDPSLERLRALNAAFVHFSHDRAVLKKRERHSASRA